MTDPVAAEGDDRHDSAGLEYDRRRVEVLRTLGDAEHPRLVQFGAQLRDYGISVLMKQWLADELRSMVGKKTAVLLPAPHSWWSTDTIRSTITYSVCRSVDPFVETAILGGGWDPAKKARVKNYFVGRCYYAFADDYRKEWKQEKRVADTFDLDDIDLSSSVLMYVHQALEPDPQVTVERRDTIRSLLSRAKHESVRTIMYLLSTGMSYREIAEQLDMTEEGVRGAKRRFLADVQRQQRRTP